jgi:hypothetical protein
MTEELIGDGRIPFPIRIGVTGHRQLDHPEHLITDVRQALSRIKELFSASADAAVVLVAVSALAEGADRLVAEEILAEEGSRLEVALPVALNDYLKDFRRTGSRQEFRGLFDRASYVWQAPPGVSREDCYQRAGRYVVDRSDAVIALWDGEPARGKGGTAEIVAYARERGTPLVWVQTKGDQAPCYEVDTERASVVRDAARKLYEYNASAIGTAELRSLAGTMRARLIPDMTADMQTDPLGLSRDNVADWLVPYFARAEILALRHQHRFRLLSSLIFMLAAASITVVAIQATFVPGWHWLAAIEVAFLLILLGILRFNRRLHLRDRWISCRFLAERLRSGYFLTLAGTGDRGSRPARLAYLSDSSEAWIERALAEVMARRPTLDIRPTQLGTLREYLAQQWIRVQIDYHDKAAHAQRRADEGLIRATELLFFLTLVAAFVHTLGISHQFWEKLLIVVSIAVPAVGAAFHGIGAQRQFRHHSERYRRMVDLLTEVYGEMADAASLERIREVAAQTEQIMREENSDWFGVMRFLDMELIT